MHSDRIFLRTKDILLIIIAGGSCLAWAMGFFNLPKVVEANQVEVAKIKSSDIEQDRRILGMQKDIDYIVKSVDEIKYSLREKEQ